MPLSGWLGWCEKGWRGACRAVAWCLAGARCRGRVWCRVCCGRSCMRSLHVTEVAALQGCGKGVCLSYCEAACGGSDGVQV